jgi:hypothetical protein
MDAFVWQAKACRLVRQVGWDRASAEALADAGVCEGLCEAVALLWNNAAVQAEGLHAIARLAGGCVAGLAGWRACPVASVPPSLGECVYLMAGCMSACVQT